MRVYSLGLFYCSGYNCRMFPNAPYLTCSLPYILYSLPYMFSSLHVPYLTCSLPYIFPTLHVSFLTCSLPYVSLSYCTCSLPYCTYSLPYMFPTLHVPYLTYSLPYIFPTLHVPYCQFSQEKRNHNPQIASKSNRADIRTLRLWKQISQRGIDTLGLLPIYEMWSGINSCYA